MRLADRAEAPLQELSTQAQSLIRALLEGLAPDGESLRLELTSDLLAAQPATRIFLVCSGQLEHRSREKCVYVAEAGDLVGLGRSLQLPEGRLQSDTTVEVLPYQLDALLRHVNSSEVLQKQWARYLLCLSSFYREALAHCLPPQMRPATGFLDFDRGEVIIREGDEADCVYTLLEGSAEAFRGEIRVGEIRAEEIFGAMALFTGQARSATVRASSPCTVLAVRKEEFLNLVSHQPQLCVGLIEEMADKINQLNQQVQRLQSQAE